MRCAACGYQHEGHWARDGFETTIGDEQFIALKTAHPIRRENPEECTPGDYDYQNEIMVQLYACPKCGTVRIN